MDGVFINLTSNDVTVTGEDKKYIIPGNQDLVTPTRDILLTSGTLSGIVSTTLGSDDVRFIQATQMFNTVYNRVTRSEQNAMLVPISLESPYIKYPFTQEQIDKINSISNGRTRLFILSKSDAIYWSSGNFISCPFRNYRLLTVVEDRIIEYPIPKTYLDSVVSGFKNIFHQ